VSGSAGGSGSTIDDSGNASLAQALAAALLDMDANTGSTVHGPGTVYDLATVPCLPPPQAAELQAVHGCVRDALSGDTHAVHLYWQQIAQDMAFVLQAPTSARSSQVQPVASTGPRWRDDTVPEKDCGADHCYGTAPPEQAGAEVLKSLMDSLHASAAPCRPLARCPLRCWSVQRPGAAWRAWSCRRQPAAPRIHAGQKAVLLLSLCSALA
jgi:hypothetical protein